MQGLHDTTLTEEAECSFNSCEQQHKFCLIWHHNGINNFLSFERKKSITSK